MAEGKNLKNQTGYVLLTTIMLLALVTVVVFSAMRTSAVELRICANERIHQQHFFLAEAGIEHAIRILEQRMNLENASVEQSGSDPAWDFAFRGPDRTPGTDDDASGEQHQPGSYEKGAVWLDIRHPDGSRYTVTVWNNDESGTGGDFDTDRDGLIWLRSDAGGPWGGGASIVALLQAVQPGGSATGHRSRAGIGSNVDQGNGDPMRAAGRLKVRLKAWRVLE